MITRAYRATDIVWDTDGQKVKLPTECTIDVEFNNYEIPEEMDDAALADRVGDALSDAYGWCVKNFGYYEIEDERCEPSEDDILERIARACEGQFNSVEYVPGGLYIDEGGVTFAVSLFKCE